MSDEPATSAGAGLGGVAVAGITAVISGVSVFVNSYGVHAVPLPSVYTTAKNLVAFAALAIGALLAGAWRRRSSGTAAARWIDAPHRTPVSKSGTGARPGLLQWIGLGYVGVVGGGLAFVLFFNGLARTAATPAALGRDTLVIWVAVLGVPFLHERVTGWNMGAIALLIGGEVALSLSNGHFDAGSGDVLVMAATVLWAVEVIMARRLMADVAPATLSLVRMGVGSATLLVYLAATGALGALLSLGVGPVGWVLLTGLLLAGYVGTWMTALSRARAVDVTSVLVASALVTALLQSAAGIQSLAPQLVGLALIAAGTAVVVWRVPRLLPA